jgi:cytoskeleton protein RodZ
MASLGQELKKQRESRNISIDEMASSTKIVGRYLEALEQDRFDAMPGGFFIKGILRTYAKYVGLDENEILERYKEAGVLDEEVKAKTPASLPLPDQAGKKKTLQWIMAGAGIIIVLIVVSMLWRSRRPRPVAPAAQPAAVLPKAQVRTEALTPAQEPAQKPAEKPAPEPAKEESKGLTMEFSFQEETWLQVFADGTLKIYGLFPAGEKARVQAEKEILLAVVGNAGGLSFLLNGKPGKMLGRPGEVLNNLRINLDNHKEFLQNKDSPGPSN